MTRAGLSSVSSDPRLAYVDLGYRFDPANPPAQPYDQLSVWIRALPTEHHYDPENVCCQVVSAQEESVTLKVRHPFSGAPAYRVGIGRVTLNDRKGKRVEAFTFGGELQIQPAAAATICIFQSPVPIFALRASNAAAAKFVTEVEVVLARLRADWDSRRAESALNKRLVALPPLTLYVSCLAAVEAQLRLLCAADQSAREVLCFIKRERQGLQANGLCAGRAAALNELLRVG